MTTVGNHTSDGSRKRKRGSLNDGALRHGKQLSSELPATKRRKIDDNMGSLRATPRVTQPYMKLWNVYHDLRSYNPPVDVLTKVAGCGAQFATIFGDRQVVFDDLTRTFAASLYIPSGVGIDGEIESVLSAITIRRIGEFRAGKFDRTARSRLSHFRPWYRWSRGKDTSRGMLYVNNRCKGVETPRVCLYFTQKLLGTLVSECKKIAEGNNSIYEISVQYFVGMSTGCNLETSGKFLYARESGSSVGCEKRVLGSVKMNTRGSAKNLTRIEKLKRSESW